MPAGVEKAKRLNANQTCPRVIVLRTIFRASAKAAGTFLYMATVHEFRRAPMIANCNTLKGFGVMLAGFLITAFVRFLIGEAHHMG